MLMQISKIVRESHPPLELNLKSKDLIKPIFEGRKLSMADCVVLTCTIVSAIGTVVCAILAYRQDRRNRPRGVSTA